MKMKRPLQIITQLVLGFSLILLILFIVQCTAKGQVPELSPTAPPPVAQGIIDEVLGSRAFGDIGAFRGLTGNKWVFEGTYGYNMTTNAALLVSYDRCYTHENNGLDNHADVLRGGLALGATLAPFKTWGLTNLFVNVGTFAEAGTETGGQNPGSLVAVAGGYIDFQVKIYKDLYGHIGAAFQNRNEQDYFAGNYAGIRGGIGCHW